MENQLLGMPKNVNIGLSYLIWPIALITVLVERKKAATRDDRVMLWTAVFTAAIGSIVWILGVVCLVFAIIAAIHAFKGEFEAVKIPFITEIVEKRVH